MSQTELTTLATCAGAVVGLFTFIKVVIEYVQQGRLKRADNFTTMRTRFTGNDTFKFICDLLECDSVDLVNVAFADKRDLLGFFEEVALQVNSNIIQRDVAYYMFGYYAIRCWESNNFWRDVNRDSPYWRLFRSFALTMKEIERNQSVSVERLHF